jgi:hypothetical protein
MVALREDAMLRALAVAVVLAFAAFQPLQAQEAEPDAVRSVIEAQLAAFQQDDFEEALSYATPAMQATVGSSEAFMTMVTRAYRPVYRPRNVVFGAFSETPGGSVLQQVFVSGPDGKSYTAVYMLEAQPDGSWKISGCVLAESGTAA